MGTDHELNILIKDLKDDIMKVVQDPERDKNDPMASIAVGVLAVLKAKLTRFRVVKQEPREIIFRARLKETGEWIEGNYHHNIRKGKWHAINEKPSNAGGEIYRDSLQMKNWADEWEDV